MAKSSESSTSNIDSAYESQGSRTSARDRLSELSSGAGQQIDNAPLIAVGAGVALGAILGAVLPRSARERELLAPLGSKLSDAGLGAADRARELGREKFDELAGDKVREFFGVSGSKSDSSNA